MKNVFNGRAVPPSTNHLFGDTENRLVGSLITYNPSSLGEATIKYITLELFIKMILFGF